MGTPGGGVVGVVKGNLVGISRLADNRFVSNGSGICDGRICRQVVVDKCHVEAVGSLRSSGNDFVTVFENHDAVFHGASSAIDFQAVKFKAEAFAHGIVDEERFVSCVFRILRTSGLDRVVDFVADGSRLDGLALVVRVRSSRSIFGDGRLGGFGDCVGSIEICIFNGNRVAAQAVCTIGSCKQNGVVNNAVAVCRSNDGNVGDRMVNVLGKSGTGNRGSLLCQRRNGAGLQFLCKVIDLLHAGLGLAEAFRTGSLRPAGEGVCVTVAVPDLVQGDRVTVFQIRNGKGCAVSSKYRCGQNGQQHCHSNNQRGEFLKNSFHAISLFVHYFMVDNLFLLLHLIRLVGGFPYSAAPPLFRRILRVRANAENTIIIVPPTIYPYTPEPPVEGSS